MPSYYQWTGGVSSNFDDPANWNNGGGYTVPGGGDAMYFGAASNPCSNLHGSGFDAITVNCSYTVTLTSAITTGTFNMNAGRTSQHADGDDITVTTSFGWTGGDINISNYSGNLNLARANPWMWSATIAPASAGTVHTGDTFKFLNGATGTFNAGHVNFTGGDGVEVNENCAVEFVAVASDILFTKNAGQDDKKVWIKTGGTATVPGPNGFGTDGIALLNEGGTFTVKGGVLASFSGSVGPVGQSGSVRQTAGVLVIENGSTLGASGAIYLSGGKLATAVRTTPGDSSLVAHIMTGLIDKDLTIAGATVEIGDPAYDPAGAGHTFSTLDVDGNVVWTSGAARLSVGWKADGNQDSDLWNATGTFTMTGGVNGAKLGPRPPVNVGTHTLVGASWWIIYGEKGTTVNVNPQKLNFEAPAQDNDWSNEVLLRNPNDTFKQLKLTHK